MKYSRVYVEITNVCNKSCSFCPGHDRSPQRMSAEDFDIITDKLRGVTEYLYYHVMGEPLTHPLLPDFIRIATQKGYKSVITTNGTLVKKLGKELIDAGVYKVNLSVHSLENANGGQLKEYLSDCADFADRASEEGVLVILRLWNNGHDGGANKEIFSTLRSRFPNGEWVPSKGGYRIRHRLHLEFGERFEWPDIGLDEISSDVFCYGLADHFSVLCDGTVVPCCLDRNGVIALGNIFEQDTSEILSSDRAVRMLEGFGRREATEELCRRCGYAGRFK